MTVIVLHVCGENSTVTINSGEYEYNINIWILNILYLLKWYFKILNKYLLI